jgi:hypothetical protein
VSGALAVVLAAAVFYGWTLRRWPWGPCRWCSGQGGCPMCKETPGRRLRSGARLVARLTHSTRI